MTDGRNLPRLTALRWYAALSVFFFHLGGAIDWRPLRVFDVGQSGVTFFFILSGFVLTWSAHGAQSPAQFYLRRAARIYPSMLITLFVAVILVTVWPAFATSRGIFGFITSIFVIQAWFPGGYPVYAYNPVAWSLSAELFFYAIFPWILVPLARSRAAIQLALATALFVGCAGATVLLARHHHGADIAFNNPLVRSSEFIVGMVMACRMRSGWRIGVPSWIAVAGVVLAGVVSRSVPDYPLFDFVMGIAFILLIATAAQKDIDGIRGWITSRVSVYLGKISFCFYLVHWLILTALVQALGWHHRWSVISGLVPLAAILTACVAGAALLHHGIEVPAERRIRGRWLSAPADRRMQSSSALVTFFAAPK